MATKYYMVSNRNVQDNGLGDRAASLSYWASEGGALDDFANWNRYNPTQFSKLLVVATGAFPLITDPGLHEEQKHLGLVVHGFNNTWAAACRRYQEVCDALFEGADSMGICVLFSWPSDGMSTNYLPDRQDAVRSAESFADLLTRLYEDTRARQEAAAADEDKACRAKITFFAHSMGNYVVQKGLKTLWDRKNQPLLLSLVNQLLMIAADVDNDLFRSGETVDRSDGDAVANLAYRITSLYSPRDATLGLSAGAKHFGKRRLGRSGLDLDVPVPDNVWQLDCSPFFPAGTSNRGVHSAYFDPQGGVYRLMRDVMTGLDRTLIDSKVASGDYAPL